MEHLRIIRDLEMKQFKPVYLLTGEEPYFIDEVADHFEQKVLDEAGKAFGLHILYGRDVSMEQVISVARGFPMMGDIQVVLVKEAQEMKEWKQTDKGESDSKKGGKKEETNYLALYLEKPVLSTLLVFTYKHKSFDKRTKLYKAFQKAGVVFSSERIKEYKIAEWITNYVIHRGLKIQPASAQLLAEYLGAELGKVVNEIDKLAISLKPGGEITPQVIEDNIGISKDYNVWELQKALSQKDVLKSNRIIHYFDANPKANPIQMVIPSLYGHFSKLAAFQQALKEKKDPVKEIGLNPYAINDLKEASKKYNPAKVERIISYLRETDRKSKGVDNYSVENGDLMKELVFKILH